MVFLSVRDVDGPTEVVSLSREKENEAPASSSTDAINAIRGEA